MLGKATPTPLFILLTIVNESSDLHVNVGVEPFIANPFVGFGKFQQVPQSHANGLGHLFVRDGKHGLFMERKTNTNNNTSLQATEKPNKRTITHHCNAA